MEKRTNTGVFDGRVLQEPRFRQPGQRLVDPKVAVRGGAAGVHDALGNALVVEVGDLLAEDEVFEKRRAASARLERVLVVVDPRALVGGQHLVRATLAEGLQGLLACRS